jgi:hypothetical protein
MNKIAFLSLILLFALAVPTFYMSNVENYSNYRLAGAQGKYPCAQTNVLLQDSYPITKKNGVTKDKAGDIWWHYPVFEVGSFDQFTNNLKFSNNPDTGRCMPAEMCGSLYKEYQAQSNYVFPIPPAKIPTKGTRVNYFDTKINLLPYRQDVVNIMY